MNPLKPRKFRNAQVPGRLFYQGEPKGRGRFIRSGDYRRARKHRNEMAHQSRKRNR